MNRTAEGMTQKEVAEALGWSPQYVAQLEKSAIRKLAILLRWYRITKEDLRHAA
jgi:transcriptional regulator with XRE-family HTH domain